MNKNTLSFSLRELGEVTGSQIFGNPDFVVSGINDIENATSNEVAFLENEKYSRFLQKSLAGILIVSSKHDRIEGKNYLVNLQPSVAFQKVVELFLHPLPFTFKDIHPTAVISEDVQIGSDVVIEPYAVISKGVEIGNGTRIGSGSFIGTKAKIGDNCIIHPRVVVREGVLIGSRVILQPGAVIGSCGFGYTTNHLGQHQALQQLGTVIIEDDVEIGANTTIDRGRFRATRIGKGTKIDNLVQIGHHVTVGNHGLIVSQTGIAGSTKVGNHVIIGGQVGIVGHLSICDMAIITAQTGLSKSILKPEIWGGSPGRPHKENMLSQAQNKKIPSLERRIRKLEELLNQEKKEALPLIES